MPHPIDVIVGKRIRLRRLQLTLSQTDLGQKLGVAFQQVQKYEKGTNRVSCSRLYEISKILDVPVTYFFSASGDAGIEVAVAEQFDVPELKDGFRLMSAFRQIQSNAVRKNIIALVETVATEAKPVQPARLAPSKYLPLICSTEQWQQALRDRVLERTAEPTQRLRKAPRAADAGLCRKTPNWCGGLLATPAAMR